MDGDCKRDIDTNQNASERDKLQVDVEGGVKWRGSETNKTQDKQQVQQE